MAWIRKRKLADGSMAYLVCWEDAAGKEQSKQFSRAKTSAPAEAAKRFKTRIEGELLAGTYVDPRAGDITVAAFAHLYRESIHQRQTSEQRLEQILRVHVLPVIGGMKMGAVRRRDIQNLINALTVKPIGGRRSADNPRPTLAGSYVANIADIVASMFKAAVLDKVIPVSPCVKIQVPDHERPAIVIPTQEQVALIAEAISPRYRALILLAAGTGLRSAELRGLDLERLRVLERVVVVNRQLHIADVVSQGYTYGPPKTKAGYRSVPLSVSYADVVAKHLARWGTGEDGLVFTNRSARPITRKSLSMALSPILSGMGFPARQGMHLFRHYYASQLIAAGLDVITVMRRLGHASSAETLETYGHLWHDREERTIEAVEASFPTLPQDRQKSGGSGQRQVTTGPKVAQLAQPVRIDRQVGG